MPFTDTCIKLYNTCDVFCLLHSHYSSPTPEKELCVDGEHRSRRDMSPQGRKRAALMLSREQPASISGYHHYRKVNNNSLYYNIESIYLYVIYIYIYLYYAYILFK